MVNVETIRLAARSVAAHAPGASAEDLVRVDVSAHLDRARRLHNPIGTVRVMTYAGEAVGTIDLVNYSDSINHERLQQAIAALSLKVLRAGCDTLQATIDISDVRQRGERAPWKALLAKRFRGALVYEQWNIAAGRVSSETDDPQSLIRGLPWMPPPQALTFDADPFVADVQGQSWLLYEHIDQRNRGEIWCRELLESGPGVPRPLLQLSTHLSYPYVFDHDGRTYMLPENSAGGQTIAYELSGTDLRLGKKHVLIDGIGVVDPTLVHFDGRWWLFGGIAGLADNAALFAWYADSPFGPYTPHSQNPLKVDAVSGRPGGTMWNVNGCLMRPAQNCSVRYGGSLSVMRVTKLTPTDFEEALDVEVTSPSADYGEGIHTLARHGNLIAIDGLRDVFTLRKLRSLI